MVPEGSAWHMILPELLREKELDNPVETPNPTELPNPTEATNPYIKALWKAWEKHRVVYAPEPYFSEEIWKIFLSHIFSLSQTGHTIIMFPGIKQVENFMETHGSAWAGQVLSFHSGLSPKQRAQVWVQVIGSRSLCIVGTKSALFLPFSRINYLILAQEESTEWKEREKGLRYHARDTALWLSSQEKIPTMLYSQILPSLETHYNVRRGKFFRLSSPLSPTFSSSVHMINLKNHSRNTLFSASLERMIKETLTKGEKVLLVHGSKGYAYMQCTICKELSLCPRCGLVLKYYHSLNEIKCSYCSYKEQGNLTCSSCKNEKIRIEGMGIERLEEEVRDFFPDISVSMWKSSDSSSPDADLLLITHPFSEIVQENVGLIAWIKADLMLGRFDFRTQENAYRKIRQIQSYFPQKPLCFQSYSPDTPFFQHVLNSKAERFLEEELRERKLFRYPPYIRCLVLYLSHPKQEILKQATENYLINISTQLSQNTETLGPQILSTKRKQMPTSQILFKLPCRQQEIQEVQQILIKEKRVLQQEKRYRGLVLLFDMDAYY
ncbi:MAG: hypothetical protein OXB93_04935 [Cytophagales bacterium]|nr:hypothetical protein [Cytophagales bacterium]